MNTFFWTLGGVVALWAILVLIDLRMERNMVEWLFPLLLLLAVLVIWII